MHDPDRQSFPPGSFQATFGDQSSEFFEKIVSIAPSILYVFDLVEMRNIWVNRSIFLGLGYTADEVSEMGAGLLEKLMHPEDMARYPDHFEKLRNLGPIDVARFEYRMLGKDGEWHWLKSEEMAFTTDENGKVTQIVGSAHEITEAKLREDRITLLVREMNHRIKNLFAVVQSMVSLTAKTKRNAPTTEAFDVIQGRVNALAIAQSLSLPTADDQLTSADELIRMVMNPFSGGNVIDIEGCGTTLTPDQSNSLAMVMHEMATNAIKYGALSRDGGQLRIEMAEKPLNETDMLEILWIEKTAFTLVDLDPDSSVGFGSRLIDRSVKQIGGTLELNWTPEGLKAKILVPIVTN